jgi:uncharacterized protein involved in oxidation of intracellular sulfur
MAVLIIVNNGPYGNETAYNALRLALSLRRQAPEPDLRVFLLGDGVGCAVPGQRTPSGYYNVERMIRHLISSGVEVHACLTCMEARGLASVELIEGVEPSNVDELAEWVRQADKALCF